MFLGDTPAQMVRYSKNVARKPVPILNLLTVSIHFVEKKIFLLIRITIGRLWRIYQ
jgi:hypothetical protein